MAQETIVILRDDLDGGKAEETIRYSFDGKSYEIDLSTDNAAKLRDVLSPYITASRKAKKRSQRRGTTSSDAPSSGPAARDVRAWAADNGIQVSAKGRVPSEIKDQYVQAMKG